MTHFKKLTTNSLQEVLELLHTEHNRLLLLLLVLVDDAKRKHVERVLLLRRRQRLDVDLGFRVIDALLRLVILRGQASSRSRVDLKQIGNGDLSDECLYAQELFGGRTAYTVCSHILPPISYL